VIDLERIAIAYTVWGDLFNRHDCGLVFAPWREPRMNKEARFSPRRKGAKMAPFISQRPLVRATVKIDPAQFAIRVEPLQFIPICNWMYGETAKSNHATFALIYKLV
jgi:hypothetical protein